MERTCFNCMLRARCIDFTSSIGINMDTMRTDWSEIHIQYYKALGQICASYTPPEKMIELCRLKLEENGASNES